jgi:hypothetical protein
MSAGIAAMRKQYHSRMLNGHRLVWDVDKLVKLAGGLPIAEVPLSQIREIDEAYWFQAGGPTPTCRAVIEHAMLIDAVDLGYPIILCPQGRVMDGMHRVARAALLGMKSIRARRFLEMPKPDHVDVALESLP